MKGLRFSKRIRLAPGVWLNLSKSGVSISLGVPGLSLNLNEKAEVRASAGIPGTGISLTRKLIKNNTQTRTKQD